MTPMASPTHQFPQLNRASACGVAPPSTIVVTPTVALTRQLTGPSSRNLSTSLGSPNAVGNPTNRRTRKAPKLACTAAPTPMLRLNKPDLNGESAGVPSKQVQKLIRNDPATMAGQTR